MNERLLVHTGGCHCGAVSFSIRTAPQVTLQRCNCSICAPSGFLHLIVPAARFELTQGDDALTDYRFGTETARHLFCRHCGIKSFYVPRSNPDGYSVNYNCLASPTFDRVVIEPFDGTNWEKNARHLAGLSQLPS